MTGTGSYCEYCDSVFDPDEVEHEEICAEENSPKVDLQSAWDNMIGSADKLIEKGKNEIKNKTN